MPDAQHRSDIPFASSNPAVARLIEACERRTLTAWEAEFIASLRRRRHPPSDKQLAILNRIAEGAPNYDLINGAAVRALPELLARWLPGGEVAGHEYTVRNPKRGDQNAGSFVINLSTGLWCDFAIGVGGRDPCALAAYLFDLQQPEAARRLSRMLGLAGEEASL